MHNVFCELRKILLNKLTVYMFVICFLINGCVIAKKPDSIRGFYNNKQAYDKMYEKLSGEVTKEKSDYITKKYNELYTKFMSNSFSQEYNAELLTGYEKYDYLIYAEMYRKYRYIEGYEASLENVRMIAKENQDYYEKTGQSGFLKYNQSIEKKYTDRTISNFYETKNYKYYLNYSFSNLCILFVLIIALKGVFCSERENRMSTLLLTSRYGKTKAFRGKVLASLLTAAGVTGLFLLEDFIVFLAAFEYKGLSEPIYSIEEMQYCIYDVSIMEYLLIMGVMKIFGMLVISSVIMLASSVASSNLSAMVISVLGILPMIVFNKENGMFNAIRLLQINNDASKMNSIFFMNTSISYIYYSLITCLILAVICIFFSYLIETRFDRIFRRERI